jgi:Immunoglobulin-like domain of bacterial spore germination/Sporulation and spore germination
MRFLALAASCLFLLAAAGCGSDDDSSSRGTTATEPPAQTTDPPAQTETEEEHENPIVISLYFLRDGQVGHARRRAGEEGPKVGTAAVEQLLAGPSAVDRAAGLRTAIPEGTRLEGLSIADGTASADLSRDLSPAAAAQVVYTLTQFPTVLRVSVNGASPVRRADLEELTPPIFVEVPAPGDEVSSPMQISGTANTFEATFQVEVLDADGEVVGKRFVTATSGSGTRGTFEAKVPFRATTKGPGKLVVYELSAEDGSRIHEVEIPLELVP